MALSDYERKMLEELEAQLKGEDPKFASSLDRETGADMRTAFSPRHLVLGLIIAVVGLLVVVGAVTWEIPLVGVLGAVIVWLGFMFVMKGTKKVAASQTAGSAPNKPSGASFMEKQQEVFKKRREEGMN